MPFSWTILSFGVRVRTLAGSVQESSPQSLWGTVLVSADRDSVFGNAAQELHIELVTLSPTVVVSCPGVPIAQSQQQVANLPPARGRRLAVPAAAPLSTEVSRTTSELQQ